MALERGFWEWNHVLDIIGADTEASMRFIAMALIINKTVWSPSPGLYVHLAYIVYL
jgi:hypothetical protein